jgi:polysaccharide export outer membrane protein
MIRRKFALFVFLAIICLAPAATFAQAVSPTRTDTVAPAVPATSVSNAADASAPSSGLLIGKGDLLQVSVYGMPDFDVQVRVNDRGDVSLPMIDSVHLEGLSTSSAEDLIQKKLVDGGFFKNPHVSVFQKEYATQGVAVLGEVQKPAVYPLLGTHKLFDVISAAGGTTPKAGKTVLISHQSGAPQEVQLTTSADPVKWAASNVEIQPGDTVVVSKAGIIYVVGDVHLPGGFVMESGNDMTVLEALAMAQGANPSASLDKAKLIRKTPSGPVEQIIPLKKILASQSSDVTMKAEDILFVPSSAAKSAFQRSLSTILQTAVGAAIYRF